MMWTRLKRVAVAVLAAGLLAAPLAAAQAAKSRVAPAAPAPAVLEQQDAQRTREELSRLLGRCPPTLRSILALDPGLLQNQAYLAPYPALAAFLAAHPEIAHNPSFYVGSPDRINPPDRFQQVLDVWESMLAGIAVLSGLAMLLGLLIWLARTIVNHRRWSRLTSVQTEVHTKLIDRLTQNEELLAYMQSPSGRRFLESAPISLEAAPKSLGAPLGRILLSLEAGLVLASAGIGLQYLSGRFPVEFGQPLHAMGILVVALGIGFIAAASVSFAISWRLGLIERAKSEAAAPGGGE